MFTSARHGSRRGLYAINRTRTTGSMGRGKKNKQTSEHGGSASSPLPVTSVAAVELSKLDSLDDNQRIPSMTKAWESLTSRFRSAGEESNSRISLSSLS